MNARTVLIALALALSIAGLAAPPAAAWDPGVTDWCSRLNMNPGPLQPVFNVICHPENLPP